MVKISPPTTTQPKARDLEQDEIALEIEWPNERTARHSVQGPYLGSLWQSKGGLCHDDAWYWVPVRTLRRTQYGDSRSILSTTTQIEVKAGSFEVSRYG